MSDAIQKRDRSTAVLAPRKGLLTREAIAVAMARWAAAYQRPVTVDVLAVYHDALHDYADDVVDLAMRRAVEESDYPATPARVRGCADAVIKERWEAESQRRQAEENRLYREAVRREDAAFAERARTIASWTARTSDPAEAIERFHVLARQERPILTLCWKASVSEDGTAICVTRTLGHVLPVEASEVRDVFARVTALEVIVS